MTSHARKSAPFPPRPTAEIELRIDEFPSADEESQTSPVRPEPVQNSPATTSGKLRRPTTALMPRTRAKLAARVNNQQRPLRGVPLPPPQVQDERTSPVRRKAANLGEISPRKRQRKVQHVEVEAAEEEQQQDENARGVTQRRVTEQLLAETAQTQGSAVLEQGESVRKLREKRSGVKLNVSDTNNESMGTSRPAQRATKSAVAPPTSNSLDTSIRRRGRRPKSKPTGPGRPRKVPASIPDPSPANQQSGLRPPVAVDQPVTRLTTIRPSELDFPAVTDEDEDNEEGPADVEDPEPEPEPEPNVGTTPRSDQESDYEQQLENDRPELGPSRQSANPEQPSNDNEPEARIRDEDLSQASMEVLWQRFVLSKNLIVKERRNGPELRDKDIQGIVKQIDDWIDRLQARVISQGESTPSVSLMEIGTSLRRLLRAQGDSSCILQHNNPRRFRGVYYHLFAKLFELVHALTVYLGPHGAFPSSPSKLKQIISAMQLVERLKLGAKGYERPPGVVIVQSIERLCGKLNQLRAQLEKCRVTGERNEERSREEAAAARWLEAEVQREAEEERMRIWVESVRKKWVALQTLRMAVEGPGFMTREKRLHLGPIGLPLHGAVAGVELDADGEPMERVGWLAPRFGPAPLRISAARAVEWTDDETEALIEGLQLYHGHGEQLLHRIIAKYCRGPYPGPLGTLNRFNVLQLVTRVADLKQYLLLRQQNEEGEVQAWVRDMPEMPGVPGVARGRENDPDA